MGVDECTLVQFIPFMSKTSPEKLSEQFLGILEIGQSWNGFNQCAVVLQTKDKKCDHSVTGTASDCGQKMNFSMENFAYIFGCMKKLLYISSRTQTHRVGGLV